MDGWSKKGLFDSPLPPPPASTHLSIYPFSFLPPYHAIAPSPKMCDIPSFCEKSNNGFFFPAGRGGVFPEFFMIFCSFFLCPPLPYPRRLDLKLTRILKPRIVCGISSFRLRVRLDRTMQLLLFSWMDWNGMDWIGIDRIRQDSGGPLEG